MTIIGNGKFGLSLLSDSDPKLISKKGLETYMGHFPAGASFKQVNHFRQLILAKKFQEYDYGDVQNIERYGQPFPPLYDLENIKNIPIALLGGETDRLASMQDFRDLRDILCKTNSCAFYKEYPFGHLGFLIPPDKTLLDELLELVIHFN
jgi:homoserine acetyltransferase